MLLILTLVVFLSCSIIQVHSEQVNNRPRGVAKSKAHLYEKKGSDWMCLDGSAKISYEAINDDYCDCVDGSDEPGTSACPNGRFYCKNVGYIPAYISSKRVNDGVCEPECCDGSDEYDGKVTCPNICEKVGAEHRKRVKELAKIQAEGAKIKREYIQFGEKLKQQHEASLERLKIELEAAGIKVIEREAALKKAQEKEESEFKTKGHGRSRKCQEKIRTLREHNDRLHEQINTLLNILKDMKRDHNQNYHDMAVKNAIKGYEEFVEEYEREMEEDMEYDQEDKIYEDEDEIEEQVPEIQIELSLSEQIHEAFLDLYNDVLEAFGLSEYVINKPERQFSRPSSGKSKEVTAAYDAFNEVEVEKKNIEKNIEEINKKLAKDYGSQQEFAKLDGECLSHDVGEYTYTVCIFGKATQKSNKDHGSTTNLGHFGQWVGSESKDDPKYYTAQLYDHGTRCWNGPDRSVKIYFECGTENKILSVSEPEKCEYLMKMTTPAVCSGSFKENKDYKPIHDEF